MQVLQAIAILSTFSKVLKRLFLNRLNPFFSFNYVIQQHQFGFNPGVSTVNAVFS